MKMLKGSDVKTVLPRLQLQFDPISIRRSNKKGLRR